MACAATGLQAQLTGTMNKDVTLTENTCYTLEGCYVINAPYKLTIPKGVTILAEANAVMIIAPGAEIDIQGTAINPVIFTSDQTSGTRTAGYWKGLVIGGLSDYNNGKIALGSCTALSAGGTQTADNSGSIKYLQIHYAGGESSYSLLANALTLAAVGSGTVLEHIEITHSLRNGLGLIAGTVDYRYGFLLDNYRNDVFVSDGYQGKVEGLLAVRNNLSAVDAVTGSNGVYLQNNNNTPSFGGTPFTRPEFNNCSFLGPLNCDPVLPINTKFDHGIMVDKNAGMDMWNSVITGYNKYGFYINDALSATRTANDELNFSYNSMTNNGSGDYDHGALPWSGCGTSMANWIEGISTTGCEEEENQFSSFVLGYDASFCGDYCDQNFVFNFVLTEDMELAFADPNTSIYEERGAIQFDKLFDWVPVCPQNQIYCTPELKKEIKEKKSDLKVIPNPVKDQASLMFDAKSLGLAKVLILDKITGRALYQKDVTIKNIGAQTISIRLNGLTEGVYPIRVEMKDAVLNGMISVQ